MKQSGKARGRRLRKMILLLIPALLIAGGLWYAYSALRLEYTVTYDTYAATTGSISNALSFSGNLSLVDSAAYTASASGTVRTLYVAPGDEVREGDRLLRLASGETVSAGFDGRVNTVSVEEGDAVSQGDSLVQIADFDHMKVSFRVDEYDIGQVRVGQACTVTVTALERQFASSVAAIDYISSSSGNVAYYTATAYVDVDGGVLPGMQVTVTIPQQEAVDVVILKVDALSFDNANQAYVWMKDDAGELTQVFVNTGVSNGNYIEITDGLADGDEVYVEAETTETAASLLSGLFGGRQFNQAAGGGMPGGDRGGASRESTGERGGNAPGGSGSRPGAGGGNG
ncbi:MAG: HlyD family efflux transporter periplasmic adaptor subunit [Clostridia bacterium]|nr:HlyD family efflux transporter periplasmic adaptor subunit [Clostridia bacterium]